MKFIYTIACYSFLLSNAWSGNDATPMGNMVGNVTSVISREFTETGEWPTMDKLNGFERVALQDKNPGVIQLFNTLAGVSGMPLLKLDGEKVKYPGLHVYAVSRVPNFDNAFTPQGKKEGGRFIVVFREESEKLATVEMHWIVESDVQMILQQIGGFDSKRIPFVFEETYIKLGGKIEELEGLNHSPFDPIRTTKEMTSKESSGRTKESSGREEMAVGNLWNRNDFRVSVALLVLISGCLAVWYARRRLKK